MTPPDFPNAIGVASIAREAHALASRHGTDPAAASAGLMVAGLQLSMAQRGIGPTLALIVHVFGDLVDSGRVRLASGVIEPFDPTQPATGCGGALARSAGGVASDPAPDQPDATPARRVLPEPAGSEGDEAAEQSQPQSSIGGL